MHYDDNFFMPHGPLAQLSGYEYRAQQQNMADVVHGVLTNGHLGLVEAGTGTGKSLAYLYPAINYALAAGEKVVISTNTINLQEQLLEKDIPVLMELGLKFKPVVVKGWTNYPCWLRLSEIEDQVDQDPLLVKLASNLEDESVDVITKTFDSLDFETREQIQAESDLCLRGRCSFFNQCPVFINRRQADKADLIIVNHHLLLADVSVRQAVGWDESAVLPSYYHLICDEAHHIEDIATEYFGVQMSLIRLRRFLGYLHRPHGKNRGILSNLRLKLERNANQEMVADVLTVLDWELLPQLRIVDEAGVMFFKVLEKNLWKKDQGQDHVLITASDLESEEILNAYDRFFNALIQLKSQLEKMISLLESDDGDKLMPYLKRIEPLISDLEFLMAVEEADYVYWLKRLPKYRGFVLQAAPIHVGAQLRDNLLFQVKSGIFTSATMSVNGSFNYFCDSIGIDSSESWDLTTVIFPSPFDFKNQVYLAVANDMPPPDSLEFPQVLVEHLAPLLDVTQGRAFILFTSYAMLNRVANLVREKGLDQDYNFLVQGELPRTQMLERFKSEMKTVLLGTDSFWEGVDVAGDALQTVIITKLPFKVPTEPITAARSKHLQSEGINPFMNYFLPQAVLKFRQGVGRLIRTKTDRGMILICDKRVVERSYGKVFLQSLSTDIIHYNNLSVIEQEVKKWF